MMKWAAVIGCGCVTGLVPPAGALALTLENAAFVGELTGGGGGKGRESLYLSQLAGMAPGASDQIRGLTFLRSANVLGPPVDAGFEFTVNHDHTGIVLDGSYSFLLARFGSSILVWSVAGLSGSYELPASDLGGHSFTHYTLARGVQAAAAQAPNGVNVADSGSTLALLGLSLTSLALARGPFKKTRAGTPQ